MDVKNGNQEKKQKVINKNHCFGKINLVFATLYTTKLTYYSTFGRISKLSIPKDVAINLSEYRFAGTCIYSFAL